MCSEWPSSPPTHPKPIGSDATAALEKIRPAVTGKSVTASGPGSDDWVVYFIVNAPANGNIEVETPNGPVHVERITGSTTARAVNASSWCRGCTYGMYVTGNIPKVEANYDVYAAL